MGNKHAQIHITYEGIYNTYLREGALRKTVIWVENEFGDTSSILRSSA